MACLAYYCGVRLCSLCSVFASCLYVVCALFVFCLLCYIDVVWPCRVRVEFVSVVVVVVLWLSWCSV